MAAAWSDIAVADDVAFMNDLIFNQGAVIGDAFAGDNFIASYWGVSVLLKSGGFTYVYSCGSDIILQIILSMILSAFCLLPISCMIS